ncbi:MAG: hypothetical protein CME70_18635 [Halobacteriovorax sp.]|nr:hypothetical protein [Halobacteriovorax sp.]
MSKLQDDMIVSIYTLLIPRMELPFIKEWIDHHLSLGVDKIYIYNNGRVPSDNDQYLQAGARELLEGEKTIKWAKKPDADYSLELSDEDVSKQFNEIINRYKGKVFLKSWAPGKDHSTPYPKSQITGYKDCARNNSSDWWFCIDVDEFLYLEKHLNIKDFLACWEVPFDSIRLELSQRVFGSRVKGESVRGVFDWGYDHPDQVKSIVKGIKFRSGNCDVDVHTIGGEQIRSVSVPFAVARYHHYRGDPSLMGGPSHRRIRCVKGVFIQVNEGDPDASPVDFNKSDTSMRKYLI